MMKLNVFAGLLVAATLCFLAPNADAQDAATTTQGSTTQECEECEGGVGIGSGALRGRVANVRGKLGSVRPVRKIADGRRVRDIVGPSPYAVPNGETQDWARFNNYPYGYYPHNFNAGPASMQVQKYNPAWQNYYPVPRRFHEGKHFVLDVF